MRNQAANTNVILNSFARPKTRSSLLVALRQSRGDRAARRGAPVGLDRVVYNLSRPRTDRSRRQGADSPHGAHDVVAGSQGARARRGAARGRTRGARKACGGEPAPRHALAIPEGRLQGRPSRPRRKWRGRSQRRRWSRPVAAFSFQPPRASSSRAQVGLQNRGGDPDSQLDEDGMIAGATGWASGLGKQQLNARHGRPINDLTEMFYAKLGLRSENP